MTVKDLNLILEKQNGLCALTGVPLTCTLELGKISNTNASIDRIIPGAKGGGYVVDNIRLVCSIVNKMRGTLTDEEFLYWCKMISEGGSAMPFMKNGQRDYKS